jgi:hypothetical protein
MDQAKSVITVRSGKVIEKPILEPCEKDDELISESKSLRVRKGLNLNIAKKRLIPRQNFHFLMP